MPYRPFTDEEYAALLKRIEDVKEDIAERHRHLSHLERELDEGAYIRPCYSGQYRRRFMEDKDALNQKVFEFTGKHISDKEAGQLEEISFKAGYEQAKKEFELKFNPDYLDFQKGVESGRIAGRIAGLREAAKAVLAIMETL